MKKNYVFLLLFTPLLSFSQNKTTFNYDVKGNLLSASYVGNNKCNNAPQSIIAADTAAAKEADNKFRLVITPVPAHSVITIYYTIPVSSNASLEIYNMVGERMAKVKSGMQKAGNYTEYFDIQSFASGMYLCVLQTNKERQVIKFLKQ
ncbi:T9SS type A sorting domain-containing protein [Limnovirga soli]|uniref:T9SS type A sorting domain-containing protein n=1 Tax=Limnovirga soli TaxID=2656915 RepID=A0A8J8FFN2_9BACT|nr:T9SS type A sorting domain-containing protein [Limnovirga soli]NNV55036.1 T9SS type A sorting domain-containing protein [Limnovirga soli]